MKSMGLQLRQRRRERQRGFSLIELLVVISIILILMAIAFPRLTSVLAGARETGAQAAMKTINQEQIQYQSEFNKFASTLAQLGPPTSTGGTEGPDAANLIPAGLAAGESSGYLFTLTATPGGYTVSAVPKTPTMGRCTFFTDQSGVIRKNWGQEPATLNSPAVDGVK
jgi:type IV pilus assembly protein PilA